MNERRDDPSCTSILSTIPLSLDHICNVFSGSHIIPFCMYTTQKGKEKKGIPFQILSFIQLTYVSGFVGLAQLKK